MNTSSLEFIPVLSRDYRESGSLLDYPDLRSACIQAYRLLLLLEDLSRMAIYLGMPEIPKGDLPLKKQWIASVVESARKIGHSLYVIDGNLLVTNERVVLLDGNQSYTEGTHYTMEGENIRILLKKFHYIKLIDPDYHGEDKRLEVVIPRNRVMLPPKDDHRIDFNDAFKSEVLMWIGYENALRSYINEHRRILYETKKGRKVLFHDREIQGEIINPPWLNEEFIQKDRKRMARLNHHYELGFASSS